MASENIVLGAFICSLLVLAALFVVFWRLNRRRPQHGATWPRTVIGNVVIFLFLSSVVTLCGEIYFRFFCDSVDSFGLTKVTQRWFQRHFRPNRWGFRDSTDYRLRVAKGMRRVTFLGDSFTVGHGIAVVNDRFANRVRAMLPDREVHVVAQCGWDTGAQLTVLKDAAVSGYELNDVVLVYCLNDIADIVPEWDAVLRRIYGSGEPNFLVKNSYLINTLYFRLKARRDPDVANYYQFVLRNYTGSVWERQQQRLGELRQHVHSRGGRLVVVTFPFLHALGPNYEYREIHEQLAAFWKRMNVPHLDLLRDLGAYSPHTVTVNRFDAHPNERAHAIAAEAIVSFLKEHE